VELLQASSHALFAGLVLPVLAPCLEAAAAAAASGSPGREAARARAWTLLGLARLHLVAPPPGTDPARKAELRRGHLLAVIEQQTDPEIQVVQIKP
jgi:hypothetical protein